MILKKKRFGSKNPNLRRNGILSISMTLVYLFTSYFIHNFIYYTHPEEKFEFSCRLFLVVFFLLRTFCQDPGNLPKLRKKNKLIFYRDTKNVPRFKKINLNGNKLNLKFCVTCGIWRAPRSSHCSPCNQCIMEFDHHCPWIGTCVGLRNYRSFLIFITLLFGYLVSLFKDITSRFFEEGVKKVRIKSGTIFRLFFFFFFVFLTVIAIVFTGALFFFHFYLGLTGKTTSELFKFPKRRMGYRDTKQEAFLRLCRGKPPSLTRIKSITPPKFFIFENYSSGLIKKIS